MSTGIFISYASADRTHVERLIAHLEARGFHCWASFRDVTAGENYQEAITRAVRASAMLLSLISRNANASIEMQKELSLASRYKLTVIPLRLENVEPNDAFAYEFATRQWIDLFRNWNGGCEKLVSEISAIAPPQRAAPRAPPMIQDYRITAASAPSRIRAPENPAELPKVLAQGFAPARSVRGDVIPPRPAPKLGKKSIAGVPMPASAVTAKDAPGPLPRPPAEGTGSAIGPVMAALAVVGFAIVLFNSIRHDDISALELFFWAVLLTGCARLAGSLLRLALYGALAPEA